jgi:hypothetical protein
MCDGVFEVSTASHGGVMVRKNAAGFLSPEAKKLGINERNYLCYEQDCDASIVYREMLDKHIWKTNDRHPSLYRFEDTVNRSLQKNHPEYLDTRRKSLISEQALGNAKNEPILVFDARKDIVFRDERYKEKFRIKDGDSIKITVAYDGEEIVRKCRWLDETHMYVGSTCLHIDEFMEKQTRVGNKYEPVPNQEPKIDIVVAEPGKPPHDAEIPMGMLPLCEIIGGDVEVVSILRNTAVVKGIGGNGTLVACGLSGENLTSLHPYEAQIYKRDLAERSPVPAEKKPKTLTQRLEAGKKKAAAHDTKQVPSKTTNKAKKNPEH